MENKNFPFNYMLTTNSIAVSYDNKHYMVTKAGEPSRYDALRAAIIAKDAAAFVEALVPKVRVIKYSTDYFEVDDANNVYMKVNLTEALPKVIAARLVEFAREDLPIEPLVYFWKKLRKNPSKNSRQMLYEFLEKNSHPITSDGNFIAYKKVDRAGNRLVDDYTKKIDNSVGKIVSMPREQVVEDRNQTCSRGLHVAAWQYAQTYFGDTLVEVLVDPTDVVSVPVDYGQQKMRVCRYKVSGIITDDKPHTEKLKADRDEKGMLHKTDVKTAVKGMDVSFVALTAKEIIDVVVTLVGKATAAPVASMSLKNKQPIVKKAKDILEARGYKVITEQPKTR
jgi:hypothetical protein